MITLSVNSSGAPVITQQTTIPSIYLDNWALIDIVKDKSLANRFIKTLKRRRGTLEFSFMNLLEISELTDQCQLGKLEGFLELVLPNLCFIDVIPRNVINREDKMLRNGERIPPHWDEKLLKFFATVKQRSVKPLSMEGLFSYLKDAEVVKILSNESRTFMQKLLDPVIKLRKKRNFDSKYRFQISRVPNGVKIQRATRYIYQDVVNSIIRDNIDLSNANHWRDLFHTIVPVAYCDFVLLDRTWAHKAQETISRLRRVGQTAEMAQVFSKKDIKKFWQAFEKTK